MPSVHLDERERFRLIGGPYNPPRFKGEWLTDAIQGKVKFGMYSNGLISWPIFKKTEPRGSGGFVLCGDLLKCSVGSRECLVLRRVCRDA